MPTFTILPPVAIFLFVILFGPPVSIAISSLITSIYLLKNKMMCMRSSVFQLISFVALIIFVAFNIDGPFLQYAFNSLIHHLHVVAWITNLVCTLISAVIMKRKLNKKLPLFLSLFSLTFTITVLLLILLAKF